MQNFLRTHSKKFLAVLGVILMVAFILPSQSDMFGGGSSTRYFVGYLGDKKVFNTDIHRAKQQWDFIEEAIVVFPDRPGAQPEMLADALRRHPAMNILAAQVTEHPEVFYLLQQEADRNGIVVLPRDMDEQFKRSGYAVRLPTGAIVPLDEVTDPNYAAAVRDAAAGLGKVERSLNRAMSAMKISRPLREYEIARQLQQIQLELAEFSADDLTDQVPAPSPDDLQKQFDTFAESLPGATPTPQNPHGFGYRYPNRVMLQYIGVRDADVRNAVLATKTKYEWDVDAQKYYQRRQAQFQTTQPTTMQTTTQPSTLPGIASTTQPTSGPTTRPFAEVRDEVVETLITPEIGRRARDLQDRINTRLRADHDAWRAKMPATRSSTTQPSTSPSAGAGGANDYASFEYLQQLAAEMERQTGILPVIASINQYKTDKELQTIDGIGSSMANQIPFAIYATQFAADVVPETERSKPMVLQLFKPSPVLRDVGGSSYVFRLTGALPSAKPKSMDEVADAVLRDWKRARAYEMVSKRANELLNSARNSSLASAAKDANLKSITTGVFDTSSQTIDNLTLKPEALAKFRFDALGLLSTAATQPSAPPLRLIELPVHGKLFVAQLLTAKPRIDTAALSMIDAIVENELVTQMSQPIYQTWFDFNQVVARTGWKDETERRKD